MQAVGQWNKHRRRRHLLARGSIVAGSGDVNDEVIIVCDRTQEMAKKGGDFKAEDA